MAVSFSATGGRRKYNRWVANETMEDFALRYTARRARRWSYARVANTALGSISFLALEAIGGALTLIYGFDAAIIAIMLAGLILFLTCLPISYYGARYGVDIDLLTRGAGFGYIGSTITSLIYATFTFIFFALEAAILAFALEFCFGVPLGLGYLLSAMVVIPLVINGFSKISAFQIWTQPFWIILHILPFVLLAYSGVELGDWTEFTGERGADGPTVMMIGAAMGVVLSLIAQIGEQVDFLRFLREPKTKAERRRWWIALLAAGPGWTVLGVAKMLAGSFLLTLAISASVPPREATDPTKMYFTAFEQVITSPFAALALTGAFVILSQLKINVTNAYAGSIAWSNFFSRITHSHPGRVIWLIFNVSIALMLMELGVFHVIESILGLYSHVALAWIGALTADLIVNKPLGLSPKGIEFRRAHLYDINPVGTGAMLAAVLVSILVLLGGAGETLQPFSSLIALATAFVVAPLIAWWTDGKYYIARPATDPETPPPQGTQTCCVCEYKFDPEDMTDCPFYAGPICSLCCTLDASCRDSCKPHAKIGVMWMNALHRVLPEKAVKVLTARLSVFMLATAIPSSLLGGLLLLIRARAQSDQLDAMLTIIFCTLLVVNGIVVWTFILIRESHNKARDEAEIQTQRLLREIRAHDRTDAALQAAKEKAEAANLAKTRYMAGISHELRTPLNAIYGYAQLMEQDRDMPADRREAVLAIRRGSEHLAALIENLLDISKIEAGRLEIYRDRINLPALLRQIAAVFQRQAREKGLDFGIQTSGNPPEWIEFDEKRLRQIIINLLSNAINYTPRGTVTLHLHYRNEVALIEVSDTGIGIEEENLERIWKPFERFAQKTSGGSGLGLTITRLLVEILGGEIKVDSARGEGTTFSVRLMLPSLRESAIPSAAWNLKERLVATGYAGPRKTVMVVDDDHDHLRLLETTLRPLGFLVQALPNAEDALAAMEDVTPDLFVLDIDMPGKTGWDLAQALRDRPAHRSTPIMMVTGHALEARQSIDREQLYDAFIVKPYSLSDFLVRMAGLLKVELLTGEQQEDDTSATANIPHDALTRMIRLAEIGHAAGISRELDAITGGPEKEAGQIARLRRHLEVFDLPGVACILKEMMQDAA